MPDPNPAGQDGEAGTTSLAPIPRAGWVHWGLRGITVLLVGLGAWWSGNILLGQNLHTVIPGRVYRGAQPTAQSLDRLVREHGIRTIVNLRGNCNPMPWYLVEAKVSQYLGICQEDISFSALHLPPPNEMRELIEVLDRAEYPIYLHCRAGADRTGLAAAVVLLLQDGIPYSQARAELGLYYGHLSFGRTGYVDRIFDLYEDWLRDNGKEHTPLHFRNWVQHEYRGGWCEGGVESVKLLKPAEAMRPIGYRVRLRNKSNTTWRFQPTVTAGMHVFFRIWDGEGRAVKEGRAGMLDASVPPGEIYEVTMVLPPLAAGTYWLAVDLIEEGHICLSQLGAEPWEEEFVVHE